MRLGIIVPDDLLKRLEPIKQYINISKICRGIIQDYVSLYEKASQQTNNNELSQRIDKLIKARMPPVVDWELLGLQDAKQWASLATDDDWDRIFEVLDYFERDGKSPFEERASIPRVQGVATYYDRLQEYDVDNGWFEKRINDKQNPYEIAQLEYQRGFLMYIIVVRNKMLEQLKEQMKNKEGEMRKQKSELKNNVIVPKTLLK
jgi:hypothetical protein